MSDDTHLFQPPSSYPEAPKDKYYQIPETKPEPQKLIQLFPWESHAPKPTRVFVNDDQSLASAHGKYSAPPMRIDPEASGHTSRTFEEPPDTWENYPRSNAWDEVPEIQRYIQTIQESRKQARKAKTQVISGTSASPKEGGSALEPPGHQQDTSSTKLTDFPSEIERPSLPVTPAPIRRPSAWNQSEQTTPSELPDAEGVPNQEEWVGLTVDVFLHLLRVSYLYWEFTESFGTSRRASASAVRSLGQSRFTS